MTQRFIAVAATFSIALQSACSAQQQPPTTVPASAVEALADIAAEKAARPVAWEPAPKLDKNGNFDKDFIKLHRTFLKRAEKGDVGLLLLGDSITAGWSGAKRAYNDAFGKHRPANFGLSGDHTEHVLWRIANGELDGIRPKVVMLMIGTNNIGDEPANIARGVAAVVEAIQAKLPETKILLLGIFPRGADPSDPLTATYRRKITEINATLARLDDGSGRVRFLDIGGQFTDAQGKIGKDVMPDELHLSRDAYERWANAVRPVIDEMMK